MAGGQASDVAGEEERHLHALPSRAPRGRGRGRGDRLRPLRDLRRGREPPSRAEGNHARTHEAMTEGHTRHRRGLLIVIFLGVIFFALLTLLILHGGKHSNKPPNQSETLSVLPMRLRIRTQPTLNAPVVTAVDSGTKLIVLE